MPREIGPERDHFGGEDGLIVETTSGGRSKYYWRCVHCRYTIGGRVFPNARARIHLSGDKSLRNGLISQVCTQAPAEVKEKFVALVKKKQSERNAKLQKRKRVDELKRSNSWSSPSKQSKLGFRNAMTNEDVDEAWGRAFFGLDIAPSKIDKDLFRVAIEATQQSKST